MTVTYSNDIATAEFGTLFKLLCRYKGSVWKILWRELAAFLVCFYAIHFIYEFGLDRLQKRIFEVVVEYLHPYKSKLPLPFVLGFFVTIVTTRWWSQYMNIPWPAGIAVYVSSTIHGYDEVGRAMRRTIMRYVCLSLTMVFRVLSGKVKARFPKMSDLIEAGLLTKSELEIIESMEEKFPGYGKNWLPIVWAASLVNRARAEGRIKDDMAVTTIIKEMNKFRGACGNLLIYNSVNIPLVYLHVVTIAVYSYFLVAVVAEQPIRTEELKSKLDTFPILLALEFVMFMGWLKVAETMINPFGQDDDDFEVNYMIDRNIQMSYLIVDEMHESHPELLKDQYWDMIPSHLPGRTFEEQRKEPNDVESFDVVNKMTSNVQIFKVPSDIETPKPSDISISKVTTSKANLIPRSSVIDDRFQNIPGVVEKQSHLQREMEKKRKKEASAERLSIISESSCDLNSDCEIHIQESFLQRRFKRRETIEEFNLETLKVRSRPSYGIVRKVNLDVMKSDDENETSSDSVSDSKDDEKQQEHEEARGSNSQQEEDQRSKNHEDSTKQITKS